MRDLITFLASYQPLYAEVVRGYPESRIEDLERTLGRPAPLAYRDFLATAAANLGFRIGDEVTFDIDEVIDLAAEKRDAMPAHLYPIAVDDVQPMADYYLDTSRAPYEGDGMVVSFACGSLAFDVLRPAYPSLRDMLFVKGFREVRMLTLPHREWVHWPFEDFADPRQTARCDELDSLLERMGLRKLDVTSEATALYERGDCAAIVFKSMELPPYMAMIAADDPKSAALVAETLCDGMRGHRDHRRW